MNKLCFLIFMLTSCTSFGQHFVSLSGGISFSDQRFNNGYESEFYKSSVFAGDVYIGKKLKGITGLNYHTGGSNVKLVAPMGKVDLNHRFTYLILPVLVGYSIEPGKLRIIPSAGIYGGFLLDQRSEYIEYVNDDVNSTLVINSKENYDEVDYGLAGRITFIFDAGKLFSIGTTHQLEYGLNDISDINAGFFIQPNMSVKNISHHHSLSIFYNFYRGSE